MNIKQASVEDAPALGELFDLYRQFYDCEANIVLSTEFIAQRLTNQEATIFIAIDDANEACGFVQLYPSYCSIDAGKILILHDLYVDTAVRNQGAGRLLMKRASEYARDMGVVRIDLLTDKTNYPGQALYEKMGYEKTLQSFYAYSLKV